MFLFTVYRAKYIKRGRTVFVVHGWMGDNTTDWMISIKDLLLKEVPILLQILASSINKTNVSLN